MFKKRISTAIISTLLMSSLSINAKETHTLLSPTEQIQENQASNWLDQESYILATNAYLWGSTLVRMEQIVRKYTDMSQPQIKQHHINKFLLQGNKYENKNVSQNSTSSCRYLIWNSCSTNSTEHSDHNG
ncbi:hypothetical protein VF_A1178 [Aliivibrio fischeri ES114]|uniref:Uncharacterized protein n=1 Tax=Aliivibrio fischeri (strain ATCC 700601 / ES114) TaxID=312309 RepID=B1WN81_ALIF1|nr:hypothetical protein [Aliivibrio fischeri]ACB55705.1 hypothetical protein VF_A1178 [Aliivibrio fischeri ES114]